MPHMHGHSAVPLMGRHMRASARLAPHVTCPCPCHVWNLPGPAAGSCSCTCLEPCPHSHTSRSRHLPYTCTRLLLHAAGGGVRSRAPRHCPVHSYIQCTPTHAPESAHALHRCRTPASCQRAARPLPSCFPPDCAPLPVFHRPVPLCTMRKHASRVPQEPTRRKRSRMHASIVQQDSGQE